MSTEETIRNKVRAIIPDVGQTSSRSYIYTISNVFTLPEPNAYQINKVTKNGVTLDSSDYTFDSDSETITITTALIENDVIIVYYNYYDYSDLQLNKYIESAIIYLSINNYTKDGEIYKIVGEEVEPILDEATKNLIAFIAGILIKPNYSEYRTSTVILRYPKNEDKDTKIKKLISNYHTVLGVSGVVSLG